MPMVGRAGAAVGTSDGCGRFPCAADVRWPGLVAAMTMARKLHLRLVRRALRTDPLRGGMGAYEHDVIEATVALTSMEKTLLIARLAWTASAFAALVSDRVREQALAELEAVE